jgi:hypothetical protein
MAVLAEGRGGASRLACGSPTVSDKMISDKINRPNPWM